MSIRRSIARQIGMLLFLMLLFTVISLALLYYYQNTQKHDAHVVNLAGRQRMLSQRISKFALSVANGADQDRKKLAESVKLYDSSLRILQDGGWAMGGHIPSAPLTMTQLFGSTKAVWSDFKKSANLIVREKRDSGAFAEAIAHVQANNEVLLGLSDKITGAFNRNFDKKVLLWRQLLFALLGIDLVLFVAGLLLANNVVKPLRTLSFVAAKIGAGDFTAKAKVRTHNEISTLAHSFNKMTEDLQKTTVSKDYVENIIKSMVDMLVVIDSEGKIKSVNQAITDLLGYRENELIGQPAEVFFAEEGIFEETILQRLIKEGEIRDYDMNYRAKNDEMIPVHFSGSVMHDRKGELVGIVGIARDMREAQKTMQALRRQETALKAAANGIVITDRDGHIIWVNPAFTRLTGYSSEEVLGQKPSQLKSGRHDQSFYRNLWETILAGHVWHNEIINRRKDGDLYTEEMTITPVRDAHGGITHFIAIKQDITKRKRAEEKLQALTESLEQHAIKLEAANKELESFSYSVSHDLRAPLRHASGFVNLLQKHAATSLDEKGRRYMKIILESVQQMDHLIVDLLDFSRVGREKVKKSRVSLGKLVEEIWHDLQEETEGRNIDWKVSPLPEVYADRSMLRLVLVNLISNALKFTRPRAQTQIEIKYTSDKENEIVFSIHDNGVGFDMKYVDKLFSVFQRLHRIEEFEGTGIGLANVQRIIHRHGGRTWAEGSVDGGATFYFSLPRLHGG